MEIIVQVPPAIEPVTLAEQKLHSRIDGDDEDAVITAAIKTARRYIERLCGVAMITQTIQLRLECFPAEQYIKLPAFPLVSVTSVAYNDYNTPTTIDPGLYVVRGVGGRGSIFPLSYWPAVAPWPDSVRVTFSAGYGDTADDVPADLRQATMLLAAHFYEHREASLAGGSASALPWGVDALLESYRERAF